MKTAKNTLRTRKAEITLRPRKITTQEEVKRKLSWRDSWRDPKTGEIEEIIYEDTGGDVVFYYDPSSKRMVPHVIPGYKPVTRCAYNETKKFVSRLTFEHEVLSDVPNREIVIGITDRILGKDFDSIISSLETALFHSHFCELDITVKEL